MAIEIASGGRIKAITSEIDEGWSDLRWENHYHLVKQVHIVRQCELYFESHVRVNLHSGHGGDSERGNGVREQATHVGSASVYLVAIDEGSNSNGVAGL